MLLKLVHQTDLTYSDLISESVMELRMAPRQEQDQHRLSFTLGVGPPTNAFSYFDWLGNSVHAFTVNSFHDHIRIVATSVVETDRIRVQPERFLDRWPAPAGSYDYATWDYLQFGGPIQDSPKLREVVDVLGAEKGMSLGELALCMLHLIADRFTYQKGVTTAASPITEILEHNYGVCQDFSHLMIAMARALNIPARYVSGLIHPDAEKYRGFTQTHAWCELLFPSAGWIGFDPANNCIVGGNFIKVAVGRHFGDVSPNKGIYRGKANESIEVAVQSEELRVVPPELAAERLQSLSIPTFQAGTRGHIDQVNQQQEQQQQGSRIIV
jgi:transglutaminase-like putative cysteine protease